MNDSIVELGQILSRDVDDYDAVAEQADWRQRNALLALAMQHLPRENDLVARAKLIQLSRALLVATDQKDLSPPLIERCAGVLISAAAADDPKDRIAVLRTLAVLVSRAGRVAEPLSSHIKEVFTHALHDSSERIRAFAHELLSPGGLLSVRLDLASPAQTSAVSHRG